MTLSSRTGLTLWPTPPGRASWCDVCRRRRAVTQDSRRPAMLCRRCDARGRAHDEHDYQGTEIEMTEKKTQEPNACTDCGSEFALTAGEIQFYQGKNFPLPKRCQNCRTARRLLKATVDQRAPWGREFRGGESI